ncbi:MAG: hypothetical protein KGJ99_10235 [Betaproteobacteria bacterium]|nr:hypothetical protein [Betaproteobacteria bacterium]
MEYYWLPIGLGLAVVVLLLLLTKLVANHKRRETLVKLGLPGDAKLTAQQLHAFRTFEDTDMRLRKSFPGIPAAQRAVIARDVLRDKGMLPKRTRNAS